MGGALWDSGIAQWVEHYGIVGYLRGRALWDSGIINKWCDYISRVISVSFTPGISVLTVVFFSFVARTRRSLSAESRLLVHSALC